MKLPFGKLDQALNSTTKSKEQIICICICVLNTHIAFHKTSIKCITQENGKPMPTLKGKKII